VYLSVITDVHSRYMVNLSLSNSMEAECAIDCIDAEFEKHGKPEKVNTNQGNKYTSELFTLLV